MKWVRRLALVVLIALSGCSAVAGSDAEVSGSVGQEPWSVEVEARIEGGRADTVSVTTTAPDPLPAEGASRHSLRFEVAEGEPVGLWPVESLGQIIVADDGGGALGVAGALCGPTWSDGVVQPDEECLRPRVRGETFPARSSAAPGSPVVVDVMVFARTDQGDVRAGVYEHEVALSTPVVLGGGRILGGSYVGSERLVGL